MTGPRRPGGGAHLVACVDVGSTFTKASLVDTRAGVLVAAAAHPTTVDSDVLDGLDAAVAGACATVGPGTRPGAVYACSSAGGGLRLAVVGYEKLVSAEAGHRVALSAGARVVHVTAGRLDAAAVAALRADRPDVVLLVGGTDGGDTGVLLHNAGRLAAGRWRRPVVLAGNAAVRPEAVRLLAGRGVPVVATGNVLPSIGMLDPGPARTAIREVFLRHVIGGKGLSRGPRFARLVHGATPDVVLTAVELLAGLVDGDLAVLDVGGATTDVYSVRSPHDGDGPLREVAGTAWHARTVEGDLGVRWSAPGVVAAARAEGLDPGDGPVPGAGAPDRRGGLATVPDPGDPYAGLSAAAVLRAGAPGLLPDGPAEAAVDLRLARLAATVAVRRHARGEALVRGGPRRGGKDLSRVRLVVGSGGVLRHAPAGAAGRVLEAVLSDEAGGWALPRAARAVVDTGYVLAAVGLLAGTYPDAARALLRRHLCPPEVTGYPVGGGAAGVDSPGDTPVR